MTYPRAAIDPAILQRLYERERSLRKVAAALQVECGIAVSAPTVAAHLRAAGIETDNTKEHLCSDPQSPDYGYVYVFYCEGFYKIGQTTDIQRRLLSMATDNPFPTELIHSIRAEDRCKTEQELHCLLREYNHRNEWFVLPDSWIKRLKAISYVPVEVNMADLLEEPVKLAHACQNPICDRKTKKPPYCDRCRLRAKRHGDLATVTK